MKEFNIQGQIWQIAENTIIKDGDKINHQMIKLKLEPGADEKSEGRFHVLCLNEIKKPFYASGKDLGRPEDQVNCLECIEARKNKIKKFHQIFKISVMENGRYTESNRTTNKSQWKNSYVRDYFIGKVNKK